MSGEPAQTEQDGREGYRFLNMSRSNHDRIWSWPTFSDLLASVAGFGLAAWLADLPGGGVLSGFWSPEWVVGLSIAAATFCLTTFLFQNNGESSLRQWIQGFSVAAGAILTVEAALLYLLHFSPIPLPVVFGGAALALAFSIILRKCLFRALAPEPSGVLFVGFDPVVGALARSLKEPPLGVLHGEPGAVPADLPYLGEPARLAEVAAATRPGRIVVSGSDRRFRVSPRLLMELRLSGIAIEDGSNLYEETFRRVCWRRLRGSALLFSPSLATDRFVMSVQAIYTNLAALGLLLLALPALVGASVAVALFSGSGPVLARTECMGFQRIPFQRLRFRTRRRDGETTWIGGTISRLRLAGLPQLINLVRGEMALFGPPPVRQEFGVRLSEMIPFYIARFAVKPGIIGWSQTRLAAWGTAPDESLRLEYDLYYVQEAIPALDLEILSRSLLGAPARPRHVQGTRKPAANS